ncbi:NADH-quinone oxidoreductase [Trametopsis cervina]|nr:NADH-quinone oxidoreductase [Trametopsis cervina]
MVFCFPCKSVGKNFKEDNEPPKPKTNGKAAETKPAAEPATAAPLVEQARVEDKPKAQPKVAIIIYTMYGHIGSLAESVKAGVEKSGGQATIYQIAETLSQDVLEKMHAPPKPAYPIIEPKDLINFDAFLLGIPTRFGNFPNQWKTFWDATGQLWANGALAGKYASIFVSSAGLGGGQETTVSSALSVLAHHGILFVPLGYSRSFAQLTNLDEVHGGSPWGAGTLASSDGSRQPSALEVEIANIQGSHFFDTVTKVFH